MAEVPQAAQQEAPDVLYQPGISFMNPRLVKIAAPVRSNPWFYEQKGVGPLSASNKLKRWENNPKLQRYNAVWNRTAKQRNMSKLGAYFHAAPTFNELGAAPPATSETSSTSRDILGFLNNAITNIVAPAAGGVTDALLKREAQKTREAEAQSQSYYPMLQEFGGTGSYTWLWIAGLGVVGLGAYIYLRRR